MFFRIEIFLIVLGEIVVKGFFRGLFEIGRGKLLMIYRGELFVVIELVLWILIVILLFGVLLLFIICILDIFFFKVCFRFNGLVCMNWLEFKLDIDLVKFILCWVW